MSGTAVPKVLRVGLFLLFLVAPATFGGDSLGRILGLSVSPDGKVIATGPWSMPSAGPKSMQ